MHKKENIVQPNLTVMVGRQGVPPPFLCHLSSSKRREENSFLPAFQVSVWWELSLLTQVLSAELHEPAS